MRNARSSFRFMTSSSLVSVTGRLARDLAELRDGIAAVPGSSIYHHSHQVYREWQTFDRPPRHDFAYWVSEVLREKGVGERLAAIDPTQHDDIRGFRQALTAVLDEALAASPKLFACAPGSEFHFCQSISVIMDTGIRAAGLGGFIEGLGRITNRSLYYHLFEARLRLQRSDNDFSIWFREQLDEPGIAEAISRMDIAVYSPEQIRAQLFLILGERQGLPPLDLVASVIQLPVDMVESLLTELFRFPRRTASRFWSKNPKVIARAVAGALKRFKEREGRNGSGAA